MDTLQRMKVGGRVNLFQSYPRKLPSGRRVSFTDLKSMGILKPERLLEDTEDFIPAVFLAAFFVVAAVVVPVLAPKAFGLALTFLLGGAALVSIWVGAFAPNIVRNLFPDPEDQRRATAHEAAHFLVGYLLGAPILSYSVSDGRPRVEFDDSNGPLAELGTSRQALDVFCLVACAGVAGEGLLWEVSKGGREDLKNLAEVLKDSVSALELADPEDQMNFTRWGLFYAATMLSEHKKPWEALQKAMADGADLAGCIEAVESTVQVSLR